MIHLGPIYIMQALANGVLGDFNVQGLSAICCGVQDGLRWVGLIGRAYMFDLLLLLLLPENALERYLIGFLYPLKWTYINFYTGSI